MSPDLMWLFPLGIGLILGAALMLGGLAFWAGAPWPGQVVDPRVVPPSPPAAIGPSAVTYEVNPRVKPALKRKRKA